MKFEDKVIYQIYPKSFKDSKGDGIGDLVGIIQKLDYLQELGVDMIWICPIFVSPQNDGGYDVEDYYKIDPLFGTMQDLEHLIYEGKKRRIGIMLDMVFNHTSAKHIWFDKALVGDEYYKQFYIFKKGNKKLQPNNWQSKFGGSAWQYVSSLDEYYLHLYDVTQPDLNWENTNVRRELQRIVNFWINKGIEGFRFDVINNVAKSEFSNSSNKSGKEFYCDQPMVHNYLKELNEKTYGKNKNIITVGEMSSTNTENCIKYTSPQNKELDMVFNFHHLKVDYKDDEKWSKIDFDFKKFKNILNHWQQKMQEGLGWNATFLNCHDQPRSISRFGDDKKYRKECAKMLATAIHMLRGTPYIYQGEEIGMTNHYFDDISKYRDVETINNYNIMKRKGMKEQEIYEILKQKSRDNARTPMQWDDTKNAGFSSATPWININPNYLDINVKKDMFDEKSIFKYYQKLIEIRKRYKVVSIGDYIPFELNPEVFSYKRIYENDELLVINNFYSNILELEIESIKKYKCILSNYDDLKLDNILKLRPYEALILIKKLF